MEIQPDEHDRAEIALHLAEEKLRLVTQIANIGIWDLDPITEILFWDEQCRKVFAYPLDLPVDYTTFLSVIHPEDREGLVEYWHSALVAGEPVEAEGRLRRFGFLPLVSLSSQPIAGPIRENHQVVRHKY